MKNILIVFSLFLLLSCSNNQTVFKVGKLVKIEEMPEEIVLNPVDSIIDPFLDGVTAIHCVVDDSLLIFRLTYDLEHNLRVVNLNDGSYLDFLYRGRGPGEALTGAFTAKRVENGRTYFDITALNEDLLMTIDLAETLREGHAVITESSDLIDQAEFSFRLGDRILSEVCYDEDLYSIKVYDKDDFDVIKNVQIYGNKNYLITHSNLFSSPMMIKPDGTRLSIPMVHFDRLNLFDIDGSNHLSITTSDEIDDRAIIEAAVLYDDRRNEYYYFDQDVTDESIFALYLMGELFGASYPKIHVFSWEGELKAVYRLNEQIYGIAISDDNSVLYGLAHDVLYRYRLD